MKIHPATILLLWAACLMAMQQLGLHGLAWMSGLSLLLAATCARARCWQMLRRTRWLLLATAILFVWGTPGEYLPTLPGATFEGLRLGAHQLLYLLMFLACLSLLLEFLGMSGLIAALHALMLPFQWCGLNRDRAALRLLLVMDYLEQPPPAEGWRSWLRQGDWPSPEVQAVALPNQAFGWPDAVLLAVALGVILRMAA